MTYPSHFPICLAHYCENCGAVTDSETACPCCTSSRLHRIPASIVSLILASTAPAPSAPDLPAPSPLSPRETAGTEVQPGTPEHWPWDASPTGPMLEVAEDPLLTSLPLNLSLGGLPGRSDIGAGRSPRSAVAIAARRDLRVFPNSRE